MAAATLSLSVNPHQYHHHHHHHHHHRLCHLHRHHHHHFTPIFHKPNNSNFRFSFSSSDSSPSPTTATPTSYLQDPFKTGRFLTNQELENLKFLDNFQYSHNLSTGSLFVRVMKPEELEITAKLLAESFSESMLLPAGYVALLRFLVKQYLIERRALMPHTATLIGFYRGKEAAASVAAEEEEKEEELAGTVEVCFDKRGANASPPTPTPPKDSPYVCNMTVKKPLRRRGIGWHLLRASEELISQMCSSREVYLHCRMIDAAPFNMYTKAGYNVVKTDSILILLMLQRRKHLMCKQFPPLESPSEPDTPASEKEILS